MHVEVKHLYKHFGHFAAATDISFRIEQGKLVGLLGPSGSGKTTVLRMLAGMEQPDSGDIFFHGKRVNDLSPQERGIGFVFQNYALFRHMTVFDNIAFGLTVQKKKKSEIRSRVSELIELTGLQGLEKRFPHQLSGGQRQRVAFARALAPRPDLLLLDEPFAAIDAKVRKDLRHWLKEMIKQVGVTSVFVTHDQEEALEVSDEIIVMNQGRVEQQGKPIDIYRHPQTAFVAHFIGDSIVLDDYSELVGFENPIANAKALIRPEDVELGFEKEITVFNASQPGIVKDVLFRGSAWLVVIQVGPYTLSGYRSHEKKQLFPGDQVRVLIHRIYECNETSFNIRENSRKYNPTSVLV